MRSMPYLILSTVVLWPAPMTHPGLLATPFTSGPGQVALMELFTTEGCSSCPPAEEAFGRLLDDPRLWKEVVPVAFHVTYFDSRSWKDRFASKAFTDRQYGYARVWSQDQVYTPCLVYNGVEWRRRDQSGAAENSGTLTAERHADGVRVTFQPTDMDLNTRYDAYAALLGGGITTHVRGGENNGRALTHEFVALVMKKTELMTNTHGVLSGTIALADKNIATTPRRALAVWVTRHGKLTPLQATGGWLD